MKKLKLKFLGFSSFLLFGCMSLSAYTAIANAETSQDSPTPITVTLKSKKQLAKEILVELGIGKQYDLYFWNSVDISTGNGSRTKFSSWLQKTLARVAGWKYVESQYVARLESDFSEVELQELLDLAKHPLMKKLLRAEIQAYEETGEKRARLLWKAWDDYNSGKINVPAHLWK
ncbi:hypothetical protein B9G53_21990 [Pseudanabaena sp. SR411]|nr:hypothetical protein B9G53_21990 [Pseudanabaena sp. SR411]